MPTPIARLALIASISLLALFFLVPRNNVHNPGRTPGIPGNPTFHRHIVAVGDLHGDLPHALKVFEMAGVIDSERNWTGDVDFLVQTGDIVDRGDDTIALYRLMENLREQARAVGGDVLSHLGNHEYMNAIGDWRYVYESEIKSFGSVAARQEVISNGWIGRAWRTNYTVTSRLPLHSSLGLPNTDYVPSSSPLSHAALSFLHGGISPTYLNTVPYPSRINSLGASLLRKLQKRKQPPPHPPNPYPGLPSDATREEHDLYGNNGPLWYRGWALDDERVVCREVDAVLEKTGTRRLIMGHTPTFDRMISRCGGKIIIIDTGISSAYGGVLSALDITYTLTPIYNSEQSASGTRAVTSAKKAERYLEQEIIQAIYPGKRDVFVSQEREIMGDAL